MKDSKNILKCHLFNEDIKELSSEEDEKITLRKRDLSEKRNIIKSLRRDKKLYSNICDDNSWKRNLKKFSHNQSNEINGSSEDENKRANYKSKIQ